MRETETGCDLILPPFNVILDYYFLLVLVGSFRNIVGRNLYLMFMFTLQRAAVVMFRFSIVGAAVKFGCHRQFSVRTVLYILYSTVHTRRARAVLEPNPYPYSTTNE